MAKPMLIEIAGGTGSGKSTFADGLKKLFPEDITIISYDQIVGNDEFHNTVIIIDGILTFHDERLRELFDIKIYADADADERILRRLRRDVTERGRDIDGVINQYVSTVKGTPETESAAKKRT